MSEAQVTENPTPEQSEGSDSSAEEAIPVQVSGESDPRMFTEADIAKAREQEKSKVYNRLETLNEEVTRLKNEADERERLTREKKEAQELEAKQKRESEMSAKELLEQKEQEWQAQLDEVRQQADQERALREQEARYSELLDVRNQVATEYSNRIAPELMDLITGETPQEIQQSAEDLAARTQRILDQTAEAVQNQRQQTPTARVTVPVSGENSGSERAFSPDDVRNMSMAEYEKHRRSLLGQGADGPKSRGLFG